MFDPASASKKIKDEFVDYISTTFSFADQDFQREFRTKLSSMISKGPIVDIKGIFETGKSIKNLVDEEVLSKLFLNLESDKPKDDKHKVKLPIERPLYVHQVEAINKISIEKRNTVITTGTGSGKTECFLIPVLNELLKEKELGTLDSGVRAILIYPMNALANDQMKRLRQILMCYPSITFGVYNGDTKYKMSEALAKYKDLHQNEDCKELREPLKNEYICREQMQNNPPHILCTNYAMLEQMLLRPENDKIFSNSNFKFIILDEAHIYTGATGMETSLLLRRLKARIKPDSNVQYILTSATLGEKGKDDQKIIDFANTLCGVHFDTNDIIYGTRKPQLNSEWIYDDKTIFNEISKLTEINVEKVKELFISHKIPYKENMDVNANIYDLCLNSHLYKAIMNKITGPQDVEKLAHGLYDGVNVADVISFIHVCMMANKDGKSLMDAKYHFFIRALEGAYIPLTKNKVLLLDRKKIYRENGKDYKVFEIGLCKYCGEIALIGKIIKDDQGIDVFDYASQYEDKEIKYLKIASEEDYIDYAYEEIEYDDIGDFQDETETQKKKEIKQIKYNLCPICGAICEYDEGFTKCTCGTPNITVIELGNTEDKCSYCGLGHFNRFYLGNEAATAVLATALFEELPVKAIKDYDGDVEVERQGGKQFLAFSDSRSDAAFFASYLDKSYKEFLRRRGVVHLIVENKQGFINQPVTVDEFINKLSKLFIENGSFKEKLSYDTFSHYLKELSLRNAWIAVMNELVGARRPSSLTNLGYIKFEYAGNDKQTIDFMLKKYSNIDYSTMKSLLDELAMSFAYFGAIETADKNISKIIEPEDKRYVFYTEKPKFLVKQKNNETNNYNGSWMARNRPGKENEFYNSAKQILVSRVLKCDLKTANEFLEYYFDKVLLTHRQFKITRGAGDFYHMPSNAFIVRVTGDPLLKYYVCDKCKRITSVNIDGLCPKIKCGGYLHETDCNFTNNHYINLYNKQDLFPLIIKEHTAQLSREEGSEYQQLFEKNKINALSCSTTFEMGVDVGDLETVFLRNVPPTTANYAQRAGRAGRSKNIAAYALTYAKLSSHDFNYFNEPVSMINGKVTAPIFKIDNKKIVLRHVFAVALSYFFKNYPEYFNQNDAKIFLENNGFDKLKKMLESHPEELKIIMVNSFGEKLNKEFDLDNFGWVKDLIGDNGVLTLLIGDYNKTVSEFNERIRETFETNDPYEIKLQKVGKIGKRLEVYKKKKIIDFLARGNVLPKYGFPVDTVELEIQNEGRDDKKELQLTRDLKLAISEYAPGEKVVANNNLYTSRYIKHSIINGKPAYNEASVCQCENCNTWNYSESGKVDEKVCVACGNKLPKINWMLAIEPSNGFITDGRIEEVPMKKPEKVYRNDDSYIGNKKAIISHLYNVNNKEVVLKSTENDQILVTSKSAFYVCPLCGFTYGVLDNIKDSNGKKDKDVARQLSMGNACKYIKPKKEHRNSFGQICKCDTLNRYFLYHVFNTDVLIMEFDHLSCDEEVMISVMYALLNAISHELDIERTDISACLKYTTNSHGFGYSIVFYDAVAGGAGHVRRLLEDKGVSLTKVFDYAVKKLNSCSCETSCYNCLRTYENQKFHDQLDRGKAIEFLKEYKDNFIFNKIIEDKEEEKIKLTIIDNGQIMSDKSLKEHLEYMIDPDEDIDYSKLNDLIKIIDKKPLDVPDYHNSKIRDNKGTIYIVDLIWNYEKVILLLPDKKEVYNKIKNSQDFNVFCLDESFDTDEFLKALRR